MSAKRENFQYASDETSASFAGAADEDVRAPSNRRIE
jgi:hypothetical protein